MGEIMNKSVTMGHNDVSIETISRSMFAVVLFLLFPMCTLLYQRLISLLSEEDSLE